MYGLRYLFRLYDREDRIIQLPSLKREHKLPVVLSQNECKQLFRSGRILKHRVLLCLIYSAGLRSKEARNLKITDVDFDRMMIHIRQTKYNKDRYVPLSPLMAKGLKKYLEAYRPKTYLFNGKEIGSPLSASTVFDVISLCLANFGSIWLGSKIPGRTDRSHHGFAYLGEQSELPSTYPLYCPRRWDCLG